MSNQQKVLEKAKHFACDFFWVDEESIEVRFVDLPDGYYGNAFEENEGEYVVEINCRLSLKDSLVTLFHELCHVRQFMVGHLYYEQSQLAWSGGDYGSEEPWEREAFRYEGILYDLYLRTFTSVERVPMLAE